MLFQLVCTDRRYQRLSCFNIRELQSALKKRFFPELIHTLDYRDTLNNTMISLRYKHNSNGNVDLSNYLFSQYSVNLFNSSRNENFSATQFNFNKNTWFML